MSIDLSPDARQAWSKFLGNQENQGHAIRDLAGENIDDHVTACMTSAHETAKRIKSDLGGFIPNRILEIGSSTGFNCYALQLIYPKAQVYGVEPEKEAVAVARTMSINEMTSIPEFIKGVGERIPISDKSIDLIVCHTVIEHVQDVPQVVSEFSRVLTDHGRVHLEAPNYIWPYEPHLQVWTIPILGKKFVKLSAIIQGKFSMIDFLDHLKFVTPFQLMRLFQKNGLAWENLVEKKLYAAVAGNADIKKYRFSSHLLHLSGKLGIAKLLVAIFIRFGLYPSVMFTLRKASDAGKNVT